MKKIKDQLYYEFEGFSIRDLLKLMCIWILISVFLGITIYSFINIIEQKKVGQIWANANLENISEEDYNTLKQYTKDYEKVFEDLKQEDTENNEMKESEKFGVYMYLSNKIVYESIIAIIMLSSLIGMVIGSVIYVVTVHKVKGWQLFLEIVLISIIIQMIFSINSQMGNLLIKYLPAYIALVSDIFVIVYAINSIKQLIITRKLNKELTGDK